ncbi:MAG: hypothetical protein ACM3S1_10725 [Hyphomicrobiales bacterium]
MRIQPNELVPLGHGVWVRSDDVMAIEPIREKRGPGRRARVWVRGIAEPLVASRSEEVIVRDLTAPRELADRTRVLESALERMTDSIDRVPPVLLRVVAQETGLDLKSLAAGAREAAEDGVTPMRGRSRRQPPANHAPLPTG